MVYKKYLLRSTFDRRWDHRKKVGAIVFWRHRKNFETNFDNSNDSNISWNWK